MLEYLPLKDFLSNKIPLNKYKLVKMYKNIKWYDCTDDDQDISGDRYIACDFDNSSFMLKVNDYIIYTFFFNENKVIYYNPKDLYIDVNTQMQLYQHKYYVTITIDYKIYQKSKEFMYQMFGIQINLY